MATPVRLVAVIFPEANMTDVESFRGRWDPLATSVTAHITVVFPFDWSDTLPALKIVLGAVVSAHRAFPVALSGVTVWEDEYLFLLAQQGGDAINRLHADLYAGPLPGLVPPETFVPHMTIGRHGEPGSLRTALGEANDAELSVTGMATTLSIYRIDDTGRPVRELDLPLAAAW
jgi:2'-5' RNA ligase